MTRSLALLFACLALGLVAAGCGGSDNSGGSGNADTKAQPAPKAEGEGGGATVSMKDIKFDPGEVTVKPGDTVTWTNDDSVGHDVTADGFKSGDPGGLQQGDTFKHKFDKAGTFDYVCSVHPGMKGAVLVQ
jgi:plastocyanin